MVKAERDLSDAYVGLLVQAKINGGTFNAGETFVVESSFVACRRLNESQTLYFRPGELREVLGGSVKGEKG